MRLVDQLFASPPGSPLAFIYNYGRLDGEPERPSDPECLGRFEKYRNRVDRVPRYTCDAVTRLIAAHPPEDWSWADDLPNCLPLHHRFWVETGRAVGPGLPPGLPDRWGFYFECLTGDELLALVAPRGLTVSPETHSGYLAQLCLSLPSSARPGCEDVMFPLLTTMVQAARDGRLAADPLTAFPYAVENELVASGPGLNALASTLLLPVLLAVGFAHSALTLKLPHSASEKLQKSRARKGKHPLRDYTELAVRGVADELRYRGQSGLHGLRAAVVGCRDLFAPKAPLILTP